LGRHGVFLVSQNPDEPPLRCTQRGKVEERRQDKNGEHRLPGLRDVSAPSRLGELEDVYVDVDTNEPMFGTVKEGLIGRHLTFAPLAGITIGLDNLQVTVSRTWSDPPLISNSTATSSPRKTRHGRR
jgi:hypothetical protein